MGNIVETKKPKMDEIKGIQVIISCPNKGQGECSNSEVRTDARFPYIWCRLHQMRCAAGAR